MNLALRAALAYSARSWRVLPIHPIAPDGSCSCRNPSCDSAGKHPSTRHGLHDATSDEQTLRGWWEDTPDAGVGIATGAASGFFVVDVDPRHGGNASLAKLEREYAVLPETVVAQTGGGGRHFLFAWPSDQALANRTGVRPGLDVRAEGGFIVAPPSKHASGSVYRWDSERHPAKRAPAPAPEWLLGIIGASSPRSAHPEQPGASIPEGKRNATLASIAGRLRRDGLSEPELRAALEAINAERCRPPLRLHEISSIAASIGRYPAANEIVAAAPIEPEPESRRFAEILDRVEAALRRYIVLPSEHAGVALALWTAHTHGFDHAEATPYMALLSAEKRSGKTRTLDVLERLVANAWRAVLPSEPVVFRKIDADRPTLLLDEVDTIFGPKAREHEGLRALLNAGHRKGSTVPRCVGEGARMTVKDFPTFCPKALAGIGELPDTIADRSIIIRMQRRAKSEPVARFRAREAERGLFPLRAELAKWAQQADFGAPAEIPDELDDRAADAWEPLLAIADGAGEAWPERARRAALALSVRSDDSEQSLGVRLLSDVRTLMSGDSALFTRALVEALNAIDEAPWGAFRDGRGIDARGLARLLRPYRVRPRDVRLADETGKGYRAADFADAWSRYCAAGSVALPIRDTGTTEEKRGLVPDSGIPDVADRNEAKSLNSQTCRRVAEGSRQTRESRLDSALEELFP